MGISKEEIIDFASRYVDPDDMVDFPFNDDIFCMMVKPLLAPKKNKDTTPDWIFAGYGICSAYTLPVDSKPVGKWIIMHYLLLNTFPPTQESLSLQPPHIVKGIFQNQDRSMEVKLIKVSYNEQSQTTADEQSGPAVSEHEVLAAKILKFPKPKKK